MTAVLPPCTFADMAKPPRRAPRPPTDSIRTLARGKRRLGEKIRALREAAGMKGVELAEAVGKTPQQITKIEKSEIGLSATEVMDFSSALQVAPAELLLGGTGFGESETSPLGDARESQDAAAMKSLAGRGEVAILILKSNALRLDGYLPGDRLLVDLGQQPQPGDFVVLNIADEESATAETAVRLFQPPAFVPRSFERSYDTFVVGDNRIAVMGVVVGSYRTTRAKRRARQRQAS